MRDELPEDHVEFSTQRSASTIARYAKAFHSELASYSSNGLLYADTLTVGFTLHLLFHAVAKPKTPLPRGKLNSFPLPSVVDFIQSHPDENVSLLDFHCPARRDNDRHTRAIVQKGRILGRTGLEYRLSSRTLRYVGDAFLAMDNSSRHRRSNSSILANGIRCGLGLRVSRSASPT